ARDAAALARLHRAAWRRNQLPAPGSDVARRTPAQRGGHGAGGARTVCLGPPLSVAAVACRRLFSECSRQRAGIRPPEVSMSRDDSYELGMELRRNMWGALAALTALTKPNQLKVHVLGALANGVSVEEIREIIMHTAVYAGIPTGVEAMAAAKEVL